jgi:hypothetical protein
VGGIKTEEQEKAWAYYRTLENTPSSSEMQRLATMTIILIISVFFILF